MKLDELVAHYGSISEASRQVGVDRNNMQAWKRKGHIPWVTQLVIEKRTKGLFSAEEEGEFNSKYSKH